MWSSGGLRRVRLSAAGPFIVNFCRNPLCDQFVVRPNPFDAKGRPRTEATIGRINGAGEKLSFINISFGASPDSFLPSGRLVEPIEGCIL